MAAGEYGIKAARPPAVRTTRPPCAMKYFEGAQRL